MPQIQQVLQSMGISSNQSVFGNTSSTGSVFGQSSTASNTSVFGQSAPSSVFGSSNPSTSTGSVFGSTAPSSVFGQPTTFGQSTVFVFHNHFQITIFYLLLTFAFFHLISII